MRASCPPPMMPTTGNPPGARCGDVTRRSLPVGPVHRSTAAGPTLSLWPLNPSPCSTAPAARWTSSCREMLKFGVVGAVAFVVDIGVFNLLRFGCRRGHAGRAAAAGQVISVTRRHTRRVAGQPLLDLPAPPAAAGAPRADAVRRVQPRRHGDRRSPAWPCRTTCWTCAAPLADNISANGVGLVLGTLFRFWAYRRFVFAGERVRRRRRPRPARSLTSAVSAVRLRLGQEQREDRRLGLDQLEPAAVGLGEVAGQREAQARTAAVLTERSKMCGAIVGGTPSPWSLTSTTTERPAAAGVHVDGATAVGQGVLQQRRQHLGQRDRRRLDHQPALAVHAHAAPGLLEGRLPLPLQRRDDRVQRHRRRRRVLVPPPGARQQVVDHAGQPLDLGDRDAGLLLDHVEVVGQPRSPPAASAGR